MLYRRSVLKDAKMPSSCRMMWDYPEIRKKAGNDSFIEPLAH